METDEYKGQTKGMLLWVGTTREKMNAGINSPTATIIPELAEIRAVKEAANGGEPIVVLINAKLEQLKCDMHTLMNPVGYGIYDAELLAFVGQTVMRRATNTPDDAPNVTFDVKHWEISLAGVGTCFFMDTLSNDSDNWLTRLPLAPERVQEIQLQIDKKKRTS